MLWAKALPQLLFVCSTLFTPPWVIREVDGLFFNFLWSNKKHHIKKETIIADIQNGGLKMIHFESMMKAIKVNWIKRIANMDTNCSVLASFFCPTKFSFTNTIELNLDMKYYKCENSFYNQILEYWFAIYTKKNIERNNIPVQIIWYNSCILIDKRPVYNQDWFSHGIKYVKQLFCLNGKLKSKPELENEYNLQIKQMDYNSITDAIPNEWKRNIIGENFANQMEINVKLYLNNQTVALQKVTCKLIYKHLISLLMKTPTAVAKWSEMYQINPQLWSSIFSLSFDTCEETILQAFQYKILIRFFSCNYILAK